MKNPLMNQQGVKVLNENNDPHNNNIDNDGDWSVNYLDFSDNRLIDESKLVHEGSFPSDQTLRVFSS